MWGRVRFMWAMLALTALLIGGLAVGMGTYVRGTIQDELASQQIFLPTLDQMSESEQGIDGIEDYAGEQITTGGGAKVYSDFIKLHMDEAAEGAGFPGATYSTLGVPQSELRTAVAEAEASGDQAALEEAQANLDGVTGLRNTMLNGSNLRGQLLNSYGWDTFGMGAIYAGAGLLVVSVIFGGAFVVEGRRGHLPVTSRYFTHNGQ